MKHTSGDCLRSGTIERDGKYYCYQHDPVKAQAEAAAAWEQRKLEIRRIEEDQDRRIARRRLEKSSGVDKLTDADLQKIIDNGGMAAVLLQLSPREGDQACT